MEEKGPPSRDADRDVDARSSSPTNGAAARRLSVVHDFV